jgi:hypothetical protein
VVSDMLGKVMAIYKTTTTEEKESQKRGEELFREKEGREGGGFRSAR